MARSVLRDLEPGYARIFERAVAAAERESVIAAHEAVAVAFVREARRICAAHGVTWPTALEAATRSYLRSWGLPALEDATS